MAVTGDALTARHAVEARLRGGKADIAGIALQVFLLLSLVISLGVLVVLLTDILIRALPAFTDRGLDLLTSPLSARPARAGMGQGIVGSLILTAFVILIALPLGVGAAVYLEEYARDTASTRFIRTNIREPGRRPGDRVRPARPGRLRHAAGHGPERHRGRIDAGASWYCRSS